MKFKAVFILYVLIFIGTYVHSQPVFNYAKAVARNTAHARSCLTDNAGNFYMTGTIFTSSNDFDPGPGTANLTSVGGNDIYIAKYDASGNYIWAKRIGGAGNDFAYEMVIDGNSNLYLVGTFSSTVDFDPNAGTTNLTASNIDGFFAKYTSNGNLVWAKKIGSSSSDFIRGIDISGPNIYITGSFANNVDVDPGPGSYILSDPAGYGSTFFGKYDTSSAFIWARSISGTGINGSEGDDIVVDASGDCFVTGYFGGTNVDFDPGVGIAYLSSSSSGGIFLGKYSSTGTYLNAFKPGSNSSGGLGFSYKSTFLALDNANNVIISGNWSGTNSDFDPGPGTAILTGNSNFVAKYTNSCNYIFAYTYVGSTMQNGMFVDPSGGIYLVGTFSGTMDFNYGAGTNNLTATASGSSAFLTKLDLNGNYLWVISPGSVSDTEGKAVHYSGGSLYICNDADNNSCSDFDYNPGPPVAMPVGNFCFGIHYVKYSDCAVAPNAPGGINGLNTVCSGASAIIYSVTPVAGASSYTWNLPGGWSGTSTTNTISVTTGPGSGTISITASNGCGTSSASALAVTIDPTPTISVASGSICSGSSFTMSPSGASSYTFSSGSAIVSPTSTTSYSITGASITGCIGSNTAVATVTVNSLPTISVNSGSICSGNSFTMSPSGASTYTFSSGSSIVSPATNTSYSVTGTSPEGCVGSNTAVASVTVVNNPTANAGSSQTITCTSANVNLSGSGVSSYTWSGPGIVSGGNTSSPVVNMAGTYSLVGSTSGCNSNTATVIVSTNTVAPTLSVTTSSNSICIGNSATLTASGASTYSWSTSATTTSVIVSPTTTTNYVLTGTNTANGCTNTINQSIGVSPLPVVTASTSNSIICGPPFQGTATITASGASTYTWNTSATTTAIAVSPNITTVYTVTGTDVNGCVNSASFTQSVSACTGIDVASTSSATGVIVYPNPTSGIVTIKAKSGDQVAVYNVVGELIFSTELKTDTMEINLDDQANGIYFVQIGSKTRKIIKH